MEAGIIVAAVLIGLALLRYLKRKPVVEGKVNNANFNEITTLAELEDLFIASKEGKRLLYLHDPWCPVSGRAIQQIAAVDTDVAIVDVSSHREISEAIEERTGIRHESPQAIILEDGSSIWTASHGRITSLAISLALEQSNEPV